MSAIFIYFILGQRRANFEFQIGWMTKCIITFLHIDHIHIFLRENNFFHDIFNRQKMGVRLVEEGVVYYYFISSTSVIKFLTFVAKFISNSLSGWPSKKKS